MNRKHNHLVIIGLVVLVLSTALNIVYAQSKRIANPILIKQYSEKIVQGADYIDIEIDYVTDIDDDRRLIGMTFEDLEYREFPVYDNNGNDFMNFNNTNPHNDEYGRYYIHKSGSMQLMLSDLDYEGIARKGSLSLVEGEARFSDGSSKKVVIGEIILMTLEASEHIRGGNHRGSSANEYSAGFRLEYPITITGIDMPFVEAHSEDISWKMLIDNNKSYSMEELQNPDISIQADNKVEVIYTMMKPNEGNYWLYTQIHTNIYYVYRGGEGVLRVTNRGGMRNMSGDSTELLVEMWRDEHE